MKLSKEEETAIIISVLEDFSRKESWTNGFGEGYSLARLDIKRIYEFLQNKGELCRFYSALDSNEQLQALRKEADDHNFPMYHWDCKEI